MNQLAWDIYVPTDRFSLRLIDTVYFNADMTPQEVKQALVDHDNYPPNIKVIGSPRL